MKKKLQNIKAGILCGGTSSEREISLKSGIAVQSAFQTKGIKYKIIDPSDGNFKNILMNSKIDVAFIALHGKFGEDGKVQKILEELKIPYTGSDSESSKKTFSKTLSRALMFENKIRIPPGYSIDLTKQDPVILARKIGYPVVVKPSSSGSSVGISIVPGEVGIKKALGIAELEGNEIVIEKYIKGRELTVGILGKKALPCLEIKPGVEFYDIDAKYTRNDTKYIDNPDLTEVKEDLQEIALKVYNLFKCRHFARVDMIIDEFGVPYVLEINTIPGLTSRSLLPRAASFAGITFNEMIIQILEMALS